MSLCNKEGEAGVYWLMNKDLGLISTISGILRARPGWQRMLAFLCALIAVVLPAGAKWGDPVLNRPYADMKRFHLGFSVGMHVQDLGFTHNGFHSEEGSEWQVEVPSFSPGFCVNVLGDLRLHNHFNLRFTPGMYFGSKTVHMLDLTSGALERQDVKSAYVVLPLDLKISGLRYIQSRPYATVGVMGTFDVSKKRSDFLRFNTTDVYLTLGLGCDFYLPFFKLIPEIKFCFGLTDILKHDRPDLDENPAAMAVTQSLKKVKSNMVVVTFYFE